MCENSLIFLSNAFSAFLCLYTLKDQAPKLRFEAFH